MWDSNHGPSILRMSLMLSSVTIESLSSREALYKKAEDSLLFSFSSATASFHSNQLPTFAHQPQQLTNHKKTKTNNQNGQLRRDLCWRCRIVSQASHQDRQLLVLTHFQLHCRRCRWLWRLRLPKLRGREASLRGREARVPA